MESRATRGISSAPAVGGLAPRIPGQGPALLRPVARARHNYTIVMSAAMKLAAWSVSATKRWFTFVERSWDDSVSDETVKLDVMGEKSRLDLIAIQIAKGM